MALQPDYAALFTASPYPYLLVDTDFLIIGANPAYLRATGRTAEDIVGKHIFVAFPVNPADPESTNLDEVGRSIELAIATREPHTSALLRYAVPRAGQEDGGFEERYWSAVHTPVFGADGEVAFVAQNAIDVTELYRFDTATRKYYLKQNADAVPDIRQMNRSQMHEAMTRILSVERSVLQKLFDHAPGFIAVLTGPAHTFEMVNDAYFDLVGHRDLLGRTVPEALPELAGQGFMELLDQAFLTGESVVLRERKLMLHRQPGGPLEDLYIDLVFQPVTDQNGRVTGIFAQGNDVTRAHAAHRALSEKIQQLEAVRSSQAFQLALADRMRELDDPDDATAAACELLGRKLQVSRVLYADVDDDAGTIFIRRDWTGDDFASLAGQTKTMDAFGPAMIAFLRAGQAVVNHDVALDSRTEHHTAAYDEIGVQADLLVPLVKGGRLRVVLTIQSAAPRGWQEHEIRLAQDVAERTWSAVEAAQAQAALRIERDQSQYIFDSMAEGFAEVDRHWTMLRMNAEGLRLNQRTAAQVVGRNHWDVFPELKGTATEAAYQRVMTTGRAEVVELDHLLPDGTRAWAEIRCYPSLGGGLAFFFRDISERKFAQEQLTTADRRKDEFLAMLAHELRNPLAPIGAAAQLLQVARLDEAAVRRTSQVIGRQVEHMTHLINDLLDVSRVTRGLVNLDSAPQDIGQVIAEAVEQVAPLVEVRHQHLALRLPPVPVLVSGDRNRLVQVLTNILNNAVKYSHESGHITLTARVVADYVEVEIRDDGIGMSAELVQHAFELFAQAERTPDRSAGGLGLGLALVKSLVELHGGTVRCRSAGPGQGSCFTVRLPHLQAEAAAAVEAAAVPDDGEGRPLRILVVDDNVDAAEMLAMLLEATGHRVAVEHDALAGLARAETLRPDVCLLDIGLPGMDGIELAQRLRALPATAAAQLVAVTGYGQESDRQRTQAAGFDYHLVKPLDTGKLFAILAER
ncbi:PAS domain S-box-containing protein [Pseudoduganella lurida]|uniref:histidine kinase n=1 Tax=Pseudoduganella lurida TaxID=1036180 RepID=A0A562RN12_9BURK|nr:PAS domain-containing protein [Pseudoduganella lurida]TWI69816.1 PAS domain S-box-containing protein [Pseudoduganella lurida]